MHVNKKKIERKSFLGYYHMTDLTQGAHIHQPMAWPVPHACAQPYHPGSGSHGQLFRLYWGSSAWHILRRLLTRRLCHADEPQEG